MKAVVRKGNTFKCKDFQEEADCVDTDSGKKHQF